MTSSPPVPKPGKRDEGDPIDIPDDQVADRANLLPEERSAGSDDPESQAEAILEDGEQRRRDAALAQDPDSPA